MRKEELFTKYELPPKGCTHKICDGEICIMNPVHLRAILEWRFVSCLYVPMLGGFLREKEGRPSKIVYKKKDLKGRKITLKSLEQVFDFIIDHELSLTIDLFCFDGSVDCKKTLDKTIWWKKCMVEDVSNGVELLQIPAVNLVDDEVPVIDEYLTRSVFLDEKKHSRRITVCCDCTDNCKDKLKCACFLQTLRAYNQDERKTFTYDTDIGYLHRKLPFKRQNMSGIYECNPKCRCNEHCLNRVVQFAPKWKLQLFKEPETVEKGWGVKALNDIPEGAFVGVYTGAMSQENQTNLQTECKEWMTSGMWKYIVNMQVIQNARKDVGKLRAPVEKKSRKKPVQKKPQIEAATKKISISFGAPNFAMIFDIPDSMKAEGHPSKELLEEKTGSWIATNITKWEQIRNILNEKREEALAKIQARKDALEKAKEMRNVKIDQRELRDSPFVTYNAPDHSIYKIPWKKPLCGEVTSSHVSSGKRRREKDSKQEASVKRLKIDTSLPIPKDLLPVIKLHDVMTTIKKFKVNPNGSGSGSAPSNNSDDQYKCETDENNPSGKKGKGKSKTAANKANSINEPGPSRRITEETAQASRTKKKSTTAKTTSLSFPLSPRKDQLPAEAEEIKTETDGTNDETADVKKGKYSLRRSVKAKNYTYKNIDNLLKMSLKEAKIEPKIKISDDLYLIDGRRQGNIGRYFNHSCVPNLFCQYVFVDNQDVRFPIVAFFAMRNIKAGEELVWSYNYDDDLDLGIDPVECKCGSGDKCRGILIC